MLLSLRHRVKIVPAGLPPLTGGRGFSRDGFELRHAPIFEA